jgi:hypothetical protein
MRSWASLKRKLCTEGQWEEPSIEQTDADGDVLIGKIVYVMGFGEGTVVGFIKKKIGASQHTIQFQDRPREEKVKLRRKGNDKVPFLVKSVLSPTYRRTRTDLDNRREPWSLNPQSLNSALTLTEARHVWQSFDEKLEADASLWKSMDARGRIIPRANMMLFSDPGDEPTIQIGSRPASLDCKAEQGIQHHLGMAAQSGHQHNRRVRGSESQRRVTLEQVGQMQDQLQGETAMAQMEALVEAEMIAKKALIVNTALHYCPLARKDWQPDPGSGMACDLCHRLCRKYGEWFSWHCDACDIDICNQCLEETRNSWACTGSKSPVQKFTNELDFTGMWFLVFVGRETKHELFIDRNADGSVQIHADFIDDVLEGAVDDHGLFVELGQPGQPNSKWALQLMRTSCRTSLVLHGWHRVDDVKNEFFGFMARDDPGCFAGRLAVQVTIPEASNPATLAQRQKSFSSFASVQRPQRKTGGASLGAVREHNVRQAVLGNVTPVSAAEEMTEREAELWVRQLSSEHRKGHVGWREMAWSERLKVSLAAAEAGSKVESE